VRANSPVGGTSWSQAIMYQQLRTKLGIGGSRRSEELTLAARALEPDAGTRG